MAYISTEEVKEIRNNIKKQFPAKDGWKFSIKKRHHSTVCVAIVKAPHNFDLKGKSYRDVNHFHIDNSWNEADAKILNQLLEIIQGIKSHHDSNAGDMGADYPAWNYHIDLSVGDWDKEFVFTGVEESAPAKEEVQTENVSFQGITLEAQTITEEETMKVVKSMIEEDEQPTNNYRVEFINGEVLEVKANDFVEALKSLDDEQVGNVKRIEKAVSTKELLAREFSAVLQNELHEDDMKQIIIDNILETDASICHTHDYVDANVVMMTAFQNVIGRPLKFNSDYDFEIINESWELAKSMNFYTNYSINPDQLIKDQG